MKKIFVLTGEPSGDKLASRVITQLKNSRTDIEYLSVGGEHLKALGIESIGKNTNIQKCSYERFWDRQVMPRVENIDMLR